MDYLEQLDQKVDNAFSCIPVADQRPDVVDKSLQNGHISVLFGLLLDVPANKLREALASDESHVLRFVVKGKQVLENDLNIRRVGLLGVGKEVDDLNQESVDELLGRMRAVAGDRKDSGQNSIKEGRDVFLIYFVADDFLNHIGDLGVQQLTSNYLDVVFAVYREPANSVQYSD